MTFDPKSIWSQSTEPAAPITEADMVAAMESAINAEPYEPVLIYSRKQLAALRRKGLNLCSCRSCNAALEDQDV